MTVFYIHKKGGNMVSSEEILLFKRISNRVNTDFFLQITRPRSLAFDEFFLKVSKLDELKKIPLDLWNYLYLLINGETAYKRGDLLAFQRFFSTSDDIGLCLFLSALSIRYGFFEAALDFRNQARLLALNNNEEKILYDNELFAYHVSSLFEVGEFESGQILLEKAGKSSSQPDKLIKKFSLLGSLVAPYLDFNVGNFIDPDFRSFLRGASVAVVSPADIDKNDGVQIDSLDLVAKCNHRDGLGKADTAKKKGYKCDLNYYNKLTVDYMIKNKIPFSKTPSWHIFKNSKQMNSLSIFSESERYRSFIHMDYCLFHGALNAIPNILIDLIAHGVKHIELFHVNFMLTPNRYSGYHPPLALPNSLKQLSGFSNHDPFTQIFLTRQLCKTNDVKTDERLKKIFTMSNYDIARNYSEVYAGLSN